MLRRQVIGSQLTRLRCGVAIGAGNARFFDMEFVIELDLTGLRLVHAFQAGGRHREHRTNGEEDAENQVTLFPEVLFDRAFHISSIL